MNKQGFDTFVGIDVGKAGAMAVLRDGRLYIYPTPCPKGEYDIFKMNMNLKMYAKTKTFAVIESASARPGQGIVSMFSFGKGYGIWLTLLNVNYMAYQIVHPVVWTKVMLCGAPGEGKDRNLSAARRLHPMWVPKTKKEEGCCDAILLAHYAERVTYGERKHE